MYIDVLAHHPDAIPTLAHWFYEEWSHLYPGRTLQNFADSMAERVNTDRIPLALVAFEGQELIGTICLKVHDMDTRTDLSPWLAGLFVKKEWRSQGVGTRLVRAVEAKAIELGLQRLYLWTPGSERFYAALGWSTTQRTVYQGCEVVIMEKSLTGQAQGTVSPESAPGRSSRRTG